MWAVFKSNCTWCLYPLFRIRVARVAHRRRVLAHAVHFFGLHEQVRKNKNGNELSFEHDVEVSSYVCWFVWTDLRAAGRAPDELEQQRRRDDCRGNGRAQARLCPPEERDRSPTRHSLPGRSQPSSRTHVRSQDSTSLRASFFFLDWNFWTMDVSSSVLWILVLDYGY